MVLEPPRYHGRELVASHQLPPPQIDADPGLLLTPPSRPQSPCLELTHRRRVGNVLKGANMTADRAFLAAAAQLLSRDRWRSFLVGPDTLVRWHRDLRWRRGRPCRPPGRPPLDPQLKHLILRLGRENPGGATSASEGRLLKLGIDVSATTIATVLRQSGLGPAPRRIGPTWTQFLRAQAYGLLSPSPGPRRRSARRTSSLLRRRHRTRAATTHPSPITANRPVTTRRRRRDNSSPSWTLGPAEPCTRLHRALEVALATDPRWLPESRSRAPGCTFSRSRAGHVPYSPPGSFRRSDPARRREETPRIRPSLPASPPIEFLYPTG